MALSRIGLIAALALAPALAAALSAAPAAAQPDPAARALEMQREIVRSAVSPECGEADGEEIVVCGRAGEDEEARRYRIEPTPPSASIHDRSGGAQRHAMAANDQRCTPIGRDQRCSGGLNILAVAGAIVRGIQAVRARRD